MTRSIWVAVIFHALSDWFVVFEKIIKDDGGVGDFAPYTLWDNLVNPLSEFSIYGPVILFLARVNRGGWPRWIEKIALKRKLIAV